MAGCLQRARLHPDEGLYGFFAGRKRRKENQIKMGIDPQTNGVAT